MRRCDCAIVLLSLVLTAPMFAQGLAAPSVTSGATHLSQAYQQWLDEDVRYIISDEERTEFLLLKSDEDRDDFVRAFWERRNPVPGSAENVFKEEHYRRLAFANQHFSASLAGWQTDRGQVYIVEGPPEAITYSREANMNVETWHYDASRVIPQAHVVRFVDRCNCGDLNREK
jgi:GWxTD domain-containing protein